MSTAVTLVGKQDMLNALMAKCPQLKLKKKRLCWDPYTYSRATKVQHEVLKEDHEFLLLTEVKRQIQEQGAPLTLEQLRGISTDYDVDLDDVEVIPESYPLEDEEVPLLLLEGSSSAANLQVETNTSDLKTDQIGS